MNPGRRSFLKAAALGLGALAVSPTPGATPNTAPARSSPRPRLGTVTYNLARD